MDTRLGADGSWPALPIRGSPTGGPGVSAEPPANRCLGLPWGSLCQARFSSLAWGARWAWCPSVEPTTFCVPSLALVTGQELAICPCHRLWGLLGLPVSLAVGSPACVRPGSGEVPGHGEWRQPVLSGQPPWGDPRSTGPSNPSCPELSGRRGFGASGLLLWTCFQAPKVPDVGGRGTVTSHAADGHAAWPPGQGQRSKCLLCLWVPRFPLCDPESDSIGCPEDWQR